MGGAKGKKIIIELDNPVKSYFPGQCVSGRLMVVTNKKKTIGGLTVRFVGKAKVRWSETLVETSGSGNNRKEERKAVVYQNEEQYFDNQLNLLGNEDGFKSNIPAGTNTFSFNFILPNGLPSSYVGKSGQVFYHLEGRMTRKSKHDLMTKVPFTVNGILDLNREPGSTQAMEIRKYKHLCCLCCKSGPIGFVFRMQKKGFVPGEVLRFLVEMNNHSSRKVKGVVLTLMQSVMFHAKGNSMHDQRAIRKIKGPPVEPGDDEIWNDVLQIPPIPPTRLANCRIIDVQYSIQIEMDLSGIAVNLKGEVPIIIGTIPLRQSFYELAQAPVEVLTVPPTAPLFEDYPDLPPPSYSQAMALEYDGSRKQGVQNVAYKSGNSSITTRLDEPDDEIDLNYVPTYITYGFNNTSS